MDSANGYVQFKNLVVSTSKTGGVEWKGPGQLLTIFFTWVWPTSNYFVIFQPGSGPLLSNFVMFIAIKLVYDTFVMSFSSFVWFCVFYRQRCTNFKLTYLSNANEFPKEILNMVTFQTYFQKTHRFCAILV